MANLIDEFCNPLPEFIALEARQEKILSQLAELKEQVSIMCEFLKKSNLEATKRKLLNEICEEKAVKNCTLQKKINVSLVVNMDPLKPPYSIYALQKIWKDTDIAVKSYTHSSIVGLTPIIFRSSAHPTSNNVIKLSLIYKTVENLETVTCLNSYPIIGEVNFLRYLSRLIDTHSYEKNNDAVFVCTTDSILDLCCRVHYQASCDKTNEALSALHNELKQTHWTGEGEPSIADIAAWSTIKQFSSRRKVPRFLNEWYEYCEKTFMGTTLAL